MKRRENEEKKGERTFKKYERVCGTMVKPMKKTKKQKKNKE